MLSIAPETTPDMMRMAASLSLPGMHKYIYLCIQPWHNAREKYSGEKMMDNNKSDELKKRYGRLAARLARICPIVQGTITERTITKEDPRNPGAYKTIGPYYQWTFKRNAKTVTVNLSAAQLKPFQKAIDNNRKIEDMLAEMRDISRQILELNTQGVPLLSHR
jgi:hypothetical protein